MYGDTRSLRADARRLRDLAGDMRDRSSTMRQQSTAMAWRSGAADTFRSRVAATCDDLDDTAESYESAAAALEEHARQVDEAKAAIDAARSWLTHRVDDALLLARGVVESIDSAATTVFHFLGAPVAEASVTQARRIAEVVGEVPPPGSARWLHLLDEFRRNGWS